jgi:hypothetical protein
MNACFDDRQQATGREAVRCTPGPVRRVRHQPRSMEASPEVDECMHLTINRSRIIGLSLLIIRRVSHSKIDKKDRRGGIS